MAMDEVWSCQDDADAARILKPDDGDGCKADADPALQRRPSFILTRSVTDDAGINCVVMSTLLFSGQVSSL